MVFDVITASFMLLLFIATTIDNNALAYIFWAYFIVLLLGLVNMPWLITWYFVIALIMPPIIWYREITRAKSILKIEASAKKLMGKSNRDIYMDLSDYIDGSVSNINYGELVAASPRLEMLLIMSIGWSVYLIFTFLPRDWNEGLKAYKDSLSPYLKKKFGTISVGN